MAAFGVELTRELYIRHFLVENSGAWHLALEKGVSQNEVDAMRAERNRVFSSLVSGAPLEIAGAHAVLQNLHGRYTMGIVTSSEREHFQLIHANTDMLRFFHFVLASGDFARSKPNPDPYLAAVARSGFQKDECVVVEDSLRGLNSALAAGLRCVVVPSDLTIGSDFSGAYAVLHSLAELEAVLGEAGR
jgi:HAD superfamily hydrolase (TIGR01509 family)